MKRIALDIICNNDAATIVKMLESVRPIIDMIVAVDIGSTDETISIIRKFSFLSNIPCHVYKRPFDNFADSRNYALDKLKDVIEELAWSPAQTWGLAIDGNERLQISEPFRKEQLSADLYGIPGDQENEYFTKRALFKLSCELRWQHPVHEILTGPNKETLLDSIHITRETKKPSPKTALTHAKLLSEYAAEGHRDFQTLYHLGGSYRAAGDYRAAEKYYVEATELGTDKEKALAHHDLAESRQALAQPWSAIQPEFLLAYNHDMQQAESIATVIRHYMATKQWALAHLFSSFAYESYHNQPPEKDPGGGRIEKRLYRWELLFYHYICCYRTRRDKETKTLKLLLKKYFYNHPTDIGLRQLLPILCSPFLFSSGKNPR